MQNTFYLSSSYLAWLGNEMAQIVKAFETQPKRLGLCRNTFSFGSVVMIARHILLRGETNNLLAKSSALLNHSGCESLSLNLTSGTSLRFGVKKGE